LQLVISLYLDNVKTFFYLYFKMHKSLIWTKILEIMYKSTILY